MDAARPASAPHRYRLLVVDDDPRALATLEAILDAVGEVVACESPAGALGRISSAERRFDVICSDYDMPAMSGTDFLGRAAALDPAASCLLITGSDEYFRAASGHFFVLQKPYEPGRLLSVVAQLARVATARRGPRAEPAPTGER